MPNDNVFMLRWFYEERGDMERYVGYDEIRASGRYPELFAAWDRLKDARRSFELELDKASEGEP